MDTVCIDKSSSAELDESIRSMYRWYRQSDVCITYLADTVDIPDMHGDSWFARGWTLQELLAPQNMVFYNKNWIFLTQNDGPKETIITKITKIKSSYQDITSVNTYPQATQSQIYQATSIDAGELSMCFKDPTLLPISRVFQLTARRHVTREEDRIYSLMGLLGISISVAYGEGLQAAFKRLFREIMVVKNNFLDVFNHSDKHRLIPSTIFKYENRFPLFDRTFLRKSTTLHDFRPIGPTSMTNLGIHVPVLLIPAFRESAYGQHIHSGAHPQSINIPQTGYNNTVEYIVFLEKNDVSTNFLFNYSSIKPPQAPLVQGYYQPKVIFCGILNFSKFGDEYQIPNRWLFVSMELPPNGRNLYDIDATQMKQVTGPLATSWASSSGYCNISRQELSIMGMRVNTLYLK